jgi:hypothetical protein
LLVRVAEAAERRILRGHSQVARPRARVATVLIQA